MAQDDTAGGRAGRPRGSAVRIEATTFVRWKDAPFDDSKGRSVYWLHLSAADGNNRTSGGLRVELPGTLSGLVEAIRIDNNLSAKPAPGGPFGEGKPRLVKVLCNSEYRGKKYRTEILLESDYKEKAAQGAKRPVKHGKILVRLYPAGGGGRAIQGIGEGKTGVLVWVR